MDPKIIRNWVIGVSFLLCSVLLFFSFVSFDYRDLASYTFPSNSIIKNYIGIVGAYIAGGLFFLFGRSAYLIIAVFIFLGLEALSFIEFRGLAETAWRRVFAFISLVISFAVLSTLPYIRSSSVMFYHGGLFGYMIGSFAVHYLNSLGAGIVAGLIFIISSLLLCGFFVHAWVMRIIEGVQMLLLKMRSRQQEQQDGQKSKENERKPTVAVKPIPIQKTAPKIEIYTPPQNTRTEDYQHVSPKKAGADPLSDSTALAKVPASALAKKDTGKDEPLVKERSSNKPLAPYKLPPEHLLSFPEPVNTSRLKEDIETNARILEETLSGFGVTAKVVSVQTGPVVTRYELEPAPGVKIQRIVSLADDITLAMKSSSVRIVAPIPGRGAVGVELPNLIRIPVFVREIISDKAFKNSSSLLSIALGKDTAGAPYVSILDDMPHLLIAGATGSGKTVCVNSLICSILYKAGPDKVKFLMVDPKTVELAPYKDIPHLIHPIMTDAKKASLVLAWLVEEMEKRYKLLSTENARNIDGYNAKEFRMPYIILIIDELADLMIVAREAIETSIQRLSQLSRAVGIHLVLATQRPSVDVITGVIKANFPSRISFKVASRVDSRTVLDFIGAERLIGKGDMLFMKAGLVKPLRLQGCFISDEDIAKMIEFIKVQSQPDYSVQLQEGSGFSRIKSKEDDLYEESVTIVLETKQASASILQRRLRVGYNRAARLIDLMEADGLVGPFQGSKPRQILTSLEEYRARQQQANT